MKSLDSIWFNTAQGTFGIVLAENDVGERKLYTGVASGLDQEADEQTILSWGNKVNIPMLLSLIAKTKKADGTRIAFVKTGFGEIRYPGTKDEQHLVQEVR